MHNNVYDKTCDKTCDKTYENDYKLEDINTYFKLPIYYNKSKMEINKVVSNDLELTTSLDPLCNSIYSHFFNTTKDPQNTTFFLKNIIIQQMSEYYTTDSLFLKDNQEFLKSYKAYKCDKSNDKSNEYQEYSENDYKNVFDAWNEIKTDTGFKEKYQYIDWTVLESVNHSASFLQIISIYNLLSPILSFCLPVIILIIPFFIIKIKGMDITTNEYIEILKQLAENHAIGKLFTKFNEVSANEKVYFIVSAAFYLFTIYQNILVCIRFNYNMIKIHNHFITINKYLNYSIAKMQDYLYYSSKLSTHTDFNFYLTNNIQILTSIKHKLETITEYKYTNYSKIFEIGHVLKYFYELYDDKLYNQTFMYSFGFHGFTMCLDGLLTNIKENKISFCEFTEKNKKTIFKNSYYASLKDENPVKNTIKLNKNLIISGPNASGKTTILKSTLINILFSQQFGCGFYDSAKIKPFKYIHCYLNIPDTSGRDSLFQAEARRCKQIIDIINNSLIDATHFCVFDELYSGTNPTEAVQSATALMEYLVKIKNVNCLLTTHFFKLCKKLDKNKHILNCYMESTKINDKIKYSYLLKTGISQINGGIYVLREMGYPKEITETT